MSHEPLAIALAALLFVAIVTVTILGCLLKDAAAGERRWRRRATREAAAARKALFDHEHDLEALRDDRVPYADYTAVSALLTDVLVLRPEVGRVYGLPDGKPADAATSSHGLDVPRIARAANAVRTYRDTEDAYAEAIDAMADLATARTEAPDARK